MKGWMLAAAFAMVAAAVLVFRLASAPAPASAVRPSHPDFEVHTASGAVALSDLRPEVTVVSFGYTACPDICPTTLARLGAAFRELSRDELKRAAAVFVSVDPARDTPERLARYARHFHPRFVGGTVPEPRLTEVAKAWGVFYEKNEGGSAMGYTMDHSTQAFLLGPDGGVIEQIPHGAPPSLIAEKLRAALEDAPRGAVRPFGEPPHD